MFFFVISRNGAKAQSDVSFYLLTNDQNVQECDATMFNVYSNARLIKIFYTPGICTFTHLHILTLTIQNLILMIDTFHVHRIKIFCDELTA